MQIFPSVIMLALGSLTISAMAEVDWTRHPAPYAKMLAEETVASHPGMLDVIFHVVPPGTAVNYAVAAHTEKEQGSKSGEDDIAVVNTGKPVVEVQKDGVRIGVILPLQDKAHRVIGALGLMYAYHAGENQSAFLMRSTGIRNNLARRIDSRRELFKSVNSLN